MAEKHPAADGAQEPAKPLYHESQQDMGLPLRGAGPPRRGRRVGDDPVSLGLRKLWQDVERESVPDEFFDLLDAIDAVRKSSESPPSNEPAALANGTIEPEGSQ
ncbi:hypothetical protein GCM10007973_11250 [Polymorphobacter multimanifer]|uniref:Anti-sigma factor NepR domain-containing protein n=1 Tax=Polymorphobacter multimanifer TaxID=1070431 RepID=A0A841L109_9SPHN|nr:NepR family anti-sigma factor [Polymorphobacter multimanifer]MBB6226100.1 hypothetical protein [Polymorphobacter multimanifer]GGI76201.1 hypothetical protein GCM10007973_11250 [Polymorphobacter multimanifer]